MKPVKCIRCGKSRGPLKFTPRDRQNKRARDEKTECICVDCQSKVQCKGCESWWDKNTVSKEDWDYKSRYGSWLCKICKDKGCSKQDATLYECTECRKELGRKRFDSKMMENHAARGSRLECQECTTSITKRLRDLEVGLKKSKRVCKCHEVLHEAKCPLTPCYAGELRWPGSDGYISREDRDFLNARKPRPKWWWRAWGH